MDYSILKKRYVGLDIFRCISALMICMFHTTIHLGCNYGLLQSLSQMGAVFMTGFFMLSGFSLFVNWGGVSLKDYRNIKRFLLKRLLAIVPMYWICSAIYVLFDLVLKNQSIIDAMILLPVEVLGIQSVFSSLFSVSHNGGTWFISCMLICYCVYPFLQELLKCFSAKQRKIILVICCLVLLYAPIIAHRFNLASIYSNPFFRLIEFLIGMILAAMKLDYKEDSIVNRVLGRWVTIGIINLLMIVCVSIAVKLNIGVGNYMLYSWICLPCFALMLYGLSLLTIESNKMRKVVERFAGGTYAFFLAQLFSNKISLKFIQLFSIDNNLIKIVIGWGICILVACVLRAIEVWIKRIVASKTNVLHA